MGTIYRIAGIDVHKETLNVVIAGIGGGDWEWERRLFGTAEADLEELAAWLAERSVSEAVMESTALYWVPVWRALEHQCRLHLAHAVSNRAPYGRKRDFADAERLVRRLVAGELRLSFVPEPEQRLWRTAARARHQLTSDRVRLQNQIEALLEDAQVKLSHCVSDLLGLSARRMLLALSQGETDPGALAALAAPGLRATPAQLRDAFRHAADLNPVYRRLLAQALARLETIEQQRQELDALLAQALAQHAGAVTRLAEVPGLGINSAQQIVAEVGADAAAFPTPANLASWAGVCLGRNESAGVSTSNRCPKGNRTLRRVLTECALAAIKTKGSNQGLDLPVSLPPLGRPPRSRPRSLGGRAQAVPRCLARAPSRHPL